MKKLKLLNAAPAWTGMRTTHAVLYHGCSDGDRLGIEAKGINLSCSRFALDFGRGFYTTSLKRQAEHWAWLRYDDPLSGPKAQRPVVLRFSVPRTQMGALQSLAFVRPAYDHADFWSLAQHCRQSVDPRPGKGSMGVVNDHGGPVVEGGKKWFDVVSGPAAASWKQKAAMLDADQFSFHTTAAVKVLNDLIVKGAPDYKWSVVV